MTDSYPPDPRLAPGSDIDLRHWREYEQIRTDTFWSFPRRSRAHGHRNEYWGNFIPQIPEQLILRYTRTDDVVLDFFLGSGTSAIEAIRLGRRLIGVEIQPEICARLRQRFEHEIAEQRLAVLCGNSRDPRTRQEIQEVLAAWGKVDARLAIYHPPYANIIRFSNDPADLSQCQSIEEFMAAFGEVLANGTPLLAPGGHCGVVIGDVFRSSEVVPLGFQCLETLRENGYQIKAIIVKDIAGNERGKGVRQNLWRYRALAGGFNIFNHEYILVGRVPVPVNRRRRPEL